MRNMAVFRIWQVKKQSQSRTNFLLIMTNFTKHDALQTVFKISAGQVSISPKFCA